MLYLKFIQMLKNQILEFSMLSPKVVNFLKKTSFNS